MATTKIEWATDVWNPATGCSPVSAGCANCYARRMAQRLRGRCGYPADEPFKVTLHPDRLDEPLKWRKPRRIFVCSMGDLFHTDVADHFVERVFTILALCSRHQFLVLTKRPQQMLRQIVRIGKSIEVLERHARAMGRTLKFQGTGLVPWPLPNVLLGISAEDQETYEDRVRWLLKCAAALLVVSLEPMLENIDLTPQFLLQGAAGVRHIERGKLPWEVPLVKAASIGWVIVGAETGPGARPMHPDWARSIRDQCQAAGVPFFFKGWGEWAPFQDNGPLPPHCRYVGLDGTVRVGDPEADTDACMGRVGKKHSGRLLDGREWNEMPVREYPT